MSIFIVSERTRIARPPETQVVNASDDVILHCDAETDPAERCVCHFISPATANSFMH